MSRRRRRRLTALEMRLRIVYPEAITISAVRAPHGWRVLVISREFLRLCPEERTLDLERRLGTFHERIALAFLATPEEEWSGEWPFINRGRFFDPKVPWRGAH